MVEEPYQVCLAKTTNCGKNSKKNTGIDPESIDHCQPIREQVSLDSMQFIGIVAQIEMELEIELPISVMQVTTYQEFLDTIQKFSKESMSSK